MRSFGFAPARTWEIEWLDGVDRGGAEWQIPDSAARQSSMANGLPSLGLFLVAIEFLVIIATRRLGNTPESPMKMRAGSQLWRRKPMQAPAVAAIRTTVPGLPFMTA